MRLRAFAGPFFALLLLPLPVFAQAPAPGVEAPRPLSERGVDNLVAFTRLLGYVRFFHPSDPVAEADWSRLALAGVQVAEKAAGPEELAQRLDAFFRPLAPTLRVYPTAGPKPEVPALEGTEAVYWEHAGVRLGTQPTIYSSTRVSAPGPQGPPAPKPGEIFTADLGGGVSASLPLSLFKDSQGTLPHVPPGAALPAPDKPEGFAPTGADRATRLAGIALAWNVFQHFYPYFDLIQVDWPAELRKALESAATDADGQAFIATLRRMIAALKDGHGNAFQAMDATSLGALPVLWDRVENQLVVTETAPEPEGLRRGDVILSIDGKPALEAVAAQEETAPGSTEGWRTYRAVRRMLFGPREVPVRLDGRHADGQAFSLTVKRSAALVEGRPLEETRPEKITEIRPGIFYVDVTRIEDADFEAALERLTAAQGIVFDLRGYPKGSPLILSHLTDRPVSSALWKVPVINRPDRQGWTWRTSSWDVDPLAPRLKAKTVFMTNGSSISYAETYLGIIEAYKLAPILGSPTAGTNGNVNPFTLPGGFTVIWTGMRVDKHDGSRLFGVGVQPTVPVSRTLKGVAEGRDELLDKAIELVTP